MEEYRLTDKQIASLKALHRTLRDKRQADRVKAVVLLGTGWTPGQVAEVLFLDDKTVRSYFLKFVQGGEDELLAMHFEGRSCWLTEEQRQELALYLSIRYLDENTCLSSGDVVRHILNTYGIHYSPTGVKELLRRLGFVDKKPKPYFASTAGQTRSRSPSRLSGRIRKTQENQGRKRSDLLCRRGASARISEIQ